MSNIVRMETTAVAAMTEAEMMDVLQNSLYPGAKPESIKLVLGYCKAAGLDPMQKPVHIVPMNVTVKKADGSESKMWRDVVMPGIGLYRTQANRTGTYVGVSEPQFGPVKKIKTKVKKWNNAHQGDKTFTMAEGEDVEFPEWCRITVKRLIGGTVAEFPAVEYWLENYATAGNDTTAPNAMWKRRPFAQLAKCAEAQALRKAFPELGAAPTADETIVPEEDFNGATIDGRTGSVEMPKSKTSSAPPPAADRPDPPHGASAAGGAEPDALLSEGERAHIRQKLEECALGEADVLAKFGVKVEGLTKSQFGPVKIWIKNPTP